MKISTSTGDFSRYFENDVDLLRELHDAGFRYVDLSLYDDRKINRVYSDENYVSEVEKLKSTAKELGLEFVLAHLPGGACGADPIKRNEQFDFFLKATIRSIEICGMLGIKHAVYHAGIRLELTDKKVWQEENYEFVKLLLPHLEKWGVTLLVENSTELNTYGAYYVNSGKELKDFVEYVNHKNVGACWDTGHANCEGSQYDDILTLGSHLKAIHYNDNHANCDEHILPFLGTLNHDEVITALIDVGFDGYFNLEANATLIRKGGWPHRRREFDKSDKLAFAPLFMQRDLEKLLYKTAKYMLESYGIFEE